MRVYTAEQKKCKSEKRKIWIKENPDKVRANKHAGYVRNSECIRAKSSKWKKDNPNKVKAQSKRYYVKKKKTSEFVFNNYKTSSKSRSLNFEIDYIQFMGFWQKSCTYCGVVNETAGLDRVDSSLGYTMGNVVPCCTACNYAKRRMSASEFISMCRRIVAIADSKKTGVIVAEEGSNACAW